MYLKSRFLFILVTERCMRVAG